MGHSTKTFAKTQETGKKGRPAIAFDLELVEKLASIGCTLDEIAWCSNCSPRSVDQHLQRDEEFRDAVEKGKALGRTSLRRMQWKAAKDGNPALLIWLGKQLLGQREKWESHISGSVTHEHVNEAREIITSRLDRLAASAEESELGKVSH